MQSMLQTNNKPTKPHNFDVLFILQQFGCLITWKLFISNKLKIKKTFHVRFKGTELGNIQNLPIPGYCMHTYNFKGLNANAHLQL